MDDLKHTMAQATKIQRAFEAKFGSGKGLVGIGIGLNASGDDLALSVLVQEQETVTELPSEFDGMDVVVDVVGETLAY
jgi:hypothetical protein